jgi:hypothetical protein
MRTESSDVPMVIALDADHTTHRHRGEQQKCGLQGIVHHSVSLLDDQGGTAVSSISRNAA